MSQFPGAFISICNSEIVQICLEAVLNSETGIYKETLFVIPFFQTSLVKQLQSILNDKRHDVVLQTFLIGKISRKYTIGYSKILPIVSKLFFQNKHPGSLLYKQGRKTMIKILFICHGMV